MIAPKQITRLGLIVGLISLIGIIPTLFLSDTLDNLRWWPAVGLGLAAIFFSTALVRGAYLSVQRRVEMVDMLNDCYQGNEQSDEVRAMKVDFK